MLVSKPGVKQWRVVSASVRGKRHEKTGQPCQDAHEWRVLPGNVLVAAVADGAGSAALADRGASLAVKSAVEQIAKTDPLRPENEAALRLLLLAAVNAARESILAEATLQKKPPRDFATTLIVLLAAPNLVGAAQVGDGAVVITEPGGKTVALTSPIQAEYLNETTFLTSPDAVEEAQVAVRPDCPTHLAAFSDGLQMLALKMPAGLPHAPFFTPLLQLAASTDNPAAGNERLAAFLRSTRISDRTDDDLTLLVAAHL